MQLITSKQDQLIPKKKFAFGSRKKEAVRKPDAEVKVQSEPKTKEPSFNYADVTGKVLKDKKGLKLEMMVCVCVIIYTMDTINYVHGI